MTAQVARERNEHGRLKKQTIPGWVKQEVARRYGAKPGATTYVKCHYCEAIGDIYWPLTYTGKVGAYVNPAPFEWDHVIPEFLGGPTTPDNLVIACRRCNRSKGIKEAPRATH